MYERTGGLQCWMTHDNFILSLTENKYRETPTEVIMGLICLLLSNKTFKAYTERICGIGYDMMCTLYGRIRTLINQNILTAEQKSLMIKLLKYLFVDKWHVLTHTNDLCQNEKGGLLHPFLPKFKNILFGTEKTNDQIVEQTWKIINKLTFAKNMRARKFKFLLYDFKKEHNKKNWKRLLKQGYTFIPIEEIQKIRDLSTLDLTLPSTEELIQNQLHQTLLLPHFSKQQMSKQPPSKKRRTNSNC